MERQRKRTETRRWSVWTKISFWFGGLITLSLEKTFVLFGETYHVVSLFHTPWKVRKLSSHQRPIKRVCWCTLLSRQLSTVLSLKTEVFIFRFLRSSVLLSCLPRSRTSVPLTLESVVLDRHCRRHIHTISYSLSSGSCCSLIVFTSETGSLSRIVN